MERTFLVFAKTLFSSSLLNTITTKTLLMYSTAAVNGIPTIKTTGQMQDVNSTITCDEVEEWSTISEPLLIAERSLICIGLSLPAGVPHFSHSYKCPTEPGVNPNGKHNQLLRWSYNSHVTSVFMLLANPCENVFNKTSDFLPCHGAEQLQFLLLVYSMRSHYFASRLWICVPRQLWLTPELTTRRQQTKHCMSWRGFGWLGPGCSVTLYLYQESQAEVCTLFVAHGDCESGLQLLSQLTCEWGRSSCS